MGVYIEALILYTVLFLSGAGGSPVGGDGAAFSVAGELARTLLYSIPALTLIWYLLLQRKSLAAWGLGLPGRKDLTPGLLALPALVLIGLTIALIVPHFNEIPQPPEIVTPATVPAWIMLCLSCISTGYLEESFFRFYLLSKREELGLGTSRAVLVSALLFALCHIYEGPWGFLNAALSGIALAIVFVRYRSLHGIALAHGLYNIFAYILGALSFV